MDGPIRESSDEWKVHLASGHYLGQRQISRLIEVFFLEPSRAAIFSHLPRHSRQLIAAVNKLVNWELNVFNRPHYLILLYTESAYLKIVGIDKLATSINTKFAMKLNLNHANLHCMREKYIKVSLIWKLHMDYFLYLFFFFTFIVKEILMVAKIKQWGRIIYFYFMCVIKWENIYFF